MVCLFKNLVNQVAIKVGTWPVTSNSLFNIFGWRSTPLWPWSGFGLTTTNYSIHWRLSHLSAHAWAYKYLPVLVTSQPGIHAIPWWRNSLKKKLKETTDILWAFLSCLLRRCCSVLSIKRTLSDYLYIKRLFIDVSGHGKPVYSGHPVYNGHLAISQVTVIYRFDCRKEYEFSNSLLFTRMHCI